MTSMTTMEPVLRIYGIDMGTIIPPPYEPPPVAAGVACALCWGIGRPLGPGSTPQFIFVQLSGINKGPDWFAALGEPMSGDFELEQVAGFPCDYILVVGPNTIRVSFRSPKTDVLVEAGGSIDMLNGDSDDLCGLFVLNTTSGFFIGGSCLIYLGEVI